MYFIYFIIFHISPITIQIDTTFIHLISPVIEANKLLSRVIISLSSEQPLMNSFSVNSPSPLMSIFLNSAAALTLGSPLGL